LLPKEENRWGSWLGSI